jgi:putative transposase
MLRSVALKANQNVLVESLNGKFRNECLNQRWFRSIEEADSKIKQWRMHYNNERPHSSLNYMAPVAFANQAAKNELSHPRSGNNLGGKVKCNRRSMYQKTPRLGRRNSQQVRYSLLVASRHVARGGSLWEGK